MLIWTIKVCQETRNTSGFLSKSQESKVNVAPGMFNSSEHGILLSRHVVAYIFTYQQLSLKIHYILHNNCHSDDKRSPTFRQIR